VELGGHSPVLREAIARKTGHLPLPTPEALVFDPTNAPDDASRVWTEGLFMNANENGSELLLQMQAGMNHFVALLPTNGGSTASWAEGSRLRLTGIISDLGGKHGEGQGINSFELLLNSPADVELIKRPPWWTFNRLLEVLAALAMGLALAFIWISMLRRQVERRTDQLTREIGERQRAENERAIEQERSRIARDLHDDLGGRITAISMLAMSSRGRKPTTETSGERLQLIANRARSMVIALDGLVWAVDPKNDTVASLAEYLASFAEEFLESTEIACRVELPQEFPNRVIVAEVRHNTLLAVREVLNNTVRHGHSSEVRLQLIFSQSDLSIVIQDNGRGFDPAHITPGYGMANLHERMRKVNGRCRVESSPGNGTTVTLTLPL